MGIEHAVGRSQDPPDTHQPVLVAVITYGHPDDEIEAALASAHSLIKQQYPVRIVIVDDCSGRPPSVSFAESISTPSNNGYSSALNFIANEVCNQESRLVLINPDAAMDVLGLFDLCWPVNSQLPIVVPQIAQDDRLENIREIYSVRSALLQLTVGRLGAQELMLAKKSVGQHNMGRPWVPAGTVASFQPEYIRQHQFDTDMFWIEMSAYARDNPDITFEIIDRMASHAGDSTRKHAGMVVRASLIHARCSYIRKYGSNRAKLALPLLLVIGLALSTITRRTSLRQARHLASVGLGRTQWNTQRS